MAPSIILRFSTCSAIVLFGIMLLWIAAHEAITPFEKLTLVLILDYFHNKLLSQWQTVGIVEILNSIINLPFDMINDYNLLTDITLNK